MVVLGEAMSFWGGVGWLASIHTGSNPKDWFFLCPLAVMLIDCFTLTVCCMLDLLDLLMY